MRRLICRAVLLALLLLPTYAMGEANWPDRDVLVNEAQKMSIQLSLLLNSESVIQLYTDSPDIVKTIQTIASYDYLKPTEAHVVFLDDIFLQSAIDLAASYGIEFPKEEWLPDVLKAKIYNIVPGLLNSREGSTWFAANSILQISKAFVLDGARGGVACVILSYGEEQPSVAVSFCIGEDSAVMASAGYIKLPNIEGEDGAALMDSILALMQVSPPDIDIDLSMVHYASLSGDALTDILEQ